MPENGRKRNVFLTFPSTYWVVIIMEFFERAAFFGMNAMLADYFLEQKIGTESQYGLIRTVLFVILYLLPVFSGALAEKWGYKRVLTVAFVLMTVGYLGAGEFTDYGFFFAAMVVLALGGGFFKPIISGTVARSTDETNSSLGFGIYYWIMRYCQKLCMKIFTERIPLAFITPRF